MRAALLCLLLAAPALGQSFESPAEVARIRLTLPRSESPVLKKLRDDPRTIWYSKSTRPLAFLRNYPVATGDQSRGEIRDRVIVAEDIPIPGRALGDGNHEFPWIATGGAELSKIETRMGLLLPPGGKIRVEPATNPPHSGRTPEGVEVSSPGGEPTYLTTYPAGAVVAEVLYQRFGGDLVTFEVRVRSKGSDGEWSSSIFRPFPTPDALASAVKRTFLDWASRPDLARLVAHCESASEHPIRSLGDYLSDVTYPATPAIARFNIEYVEGHRAPDPGYARNDIALRLYRLRASVDTPPTIEPAHARKLLAETSFVDATGLVWSDGRDGSKGYAPTTEADGQVIPKGWLGAFVEPSNAACNTCHRTAGVHVNQTFAHRYWYGFIRGGDGMFSFHPWAEDSISRLGDDREPTAPRIDPRIAHLVDFRP